MAKRLLDNQFYDGVALPTTPNVYMALFHNSTGTTEANLRNNIIINEITDAGYTRILAAVTPSSDFDAAIDNNPGVVTTNAIDINFQPAAADYPNTVTHVAIMDAVTNGNVIVVAPFTSPISITIAQFIKIAAGSFEVVL